MKLMKALVVMALVLFMAAPAFAEMKLNGYYRLQGTYYDVDKTGSDAAEDIVQRLRMKLTNTLNDNVSFVYYGEFDTDWGQGDKFGGNGGKRGADGNALETKNVYLALKNDNMNATLGIQGYSDIFSGLLFSDDAAGATFGTKLGAADLSLAYFKMDEGGATADDDNDVYAATIAFPVTDAFTVTAGVYVDDEEGSAATQAYCTTLAGCKDAIDGTTAAVATTYNSAKAVSEGTNVYYGLRADAKVSDTLSLSAFGLIADLEDGDTYVLDASAKLKLANGSLLFEALYAPEEGDSADAFNDIAGGNFFYNGQNLMFLLRDVYATNNWEGEGKYQDAIGGAGLTMLMLSGNFDFDAFYAGFGLGWADTDSEDLGMEYGVKVGKKFFGNVDVSVRAAKWAAGDFYDTADYDETKVIGMVNVGF